MRHELVLCTRNRPEDARRCLDSVAAQSMRPDRVVIVDSSDTDATQRVAEDFTRRSGVVTEFVRTTPGLTLQRNAGLDRLDDSTEVTHFVDDDTVLDPDYLRCILALFEEFPEAGGVGGRIANQPKDAPRWYHRAFLLHSRRQGVLLRSGVGVLSHSGHQARRVGWLSGCSMSYRCSSVAGLRFDESRSGNGVGEDVDFSARVAARAQLVWTPGAVLEHRKSPINREDEALVRRRVVRHRWRLASDRVGSVSRTAVLYSVVGEVLISLLAAGLLRSSRHGRRAVASAAGLADIVKGAPV